jgi:hypothetical protein
METGADVISGCALVEQLDDRRIHDRRHDGMTEGFQRFCQKAKNFGYPP